MGRGEKGARAGKPVGERGKCPLFAGFLSFPLSPKGVPPHSVVSLQAEITKIWRAINPQKTNNTKFPKQTKQQNKKQGAYAPRLILMIHRLAVRCNIKPASGRVGKIAQRFHAPADGKPELTGGLQSAVGAEIP